MEEMTFKIKTSSHDWEHVKDLIEKISATYSGNCKLRIEVEFDDTGLPVYYSPKST